METKGRQTRPFGTIRAKKEIMKEYNEIWFNMLNNIKINFDSTCYIYNSDLYYIQYYIY